MASADVPRPRPGRPAQLSRERIVSAALSGGNLDVLTMRELAARLGVTHGALYRWVADREQLFDLVSEVMVERVLPPDPAGGRQWRPRLTRLALAMHDEFLAVPGYATRLSRPHRHSQAAYHRLRDEVVGTFRSAGVEPDMAEQSWYIFITAVVSWLATEEAPLHHEGPAPRYDLFLAALLRGLPARRDPTGPAHPGGRAG